MMFRGEVWGHWEADRQGETQLLSGVAVETGTNQLCHLNGRDTPQATLPSQWPNVDCALGINAFVLQARTK